MLERAVEADAERERLKLDMAHSKLARLQAERTNQAAVHECNARRNLREIQRDVRLEEVRWKSPCNRYTDLINEVVMYDI